MILQEYCRWRKIVMFRTAAIKRHDKFLWFRFPGYFLVPSIANCLSWLHVIIGLGLAMVPQFCRERLFRPLVVALVALALVLSPAGCRRYRQEIAAYLDAAHQLWGFDGAVVIARNGRMLFKQGYGLAAR